MEIKTFKSFINEKSMKEVKQRMDILVLNSYLYTQELNEEFIESKEIRTGKQGLKSKYAIQFNKYMKNKTYNKLQDFNKIYLDNILYKQAYIKEINNLMDLSDIEFIEYLDDFIRGLWTVLDEKIYRLNKITVLDDYEDFTKTISLDSLIKMRKDFNIFVNIIFLIMRHEVKEDYTIVLGNEAKRLSKKKLLPCITIDIENLEESGCDIFIETKKPS